MATDEELAPGAKITVMKQVHLGEDVWMMRLARERVLIADQEMVWFDAGGQTCIPRDAESETWCLGWDDETAAALSATAKLLAGAA